MPAEKSGDVERFDEVAEDYSELHTQVLGASGEPIGYFAQYKIDRLKRLGFSSDTTVLDYGCGIGNLTSLLVENFSSVVGFDPSAGSIAVARDRLPKVTFHTESETIVDSSFQLAVLAGVLHHVDPVDRAGVVGDALSKVAPGGSIVVFEHNPHNPLTVRAVRDCAFDEDAILLRPREVRRLLADSGAVNVRQYFVVFFPRTLALLRGLEPALGWVPIGAQTMTVGLRA